MSSTRVVGCEAVYGGSELAEVPDLSTTPARYIAALCPSLTAPSTTDHVPVDKLSAIVVDVPSKALVASTRPSGSTNRWGYMGSSRFALGSDVHLFVAGL